MISILILIMLICCALIVAGFTASSHRKLLLSAGLAIPAYLAGLYVWFAILYFRYISIEVPAGAIGVIYFFLPPLIFVLLILLVVNRLILRNW